MTDRWEWSEKHRRWERQSGDLTLFVTPCKVDNQIGSWQYDIYEGHIPAEDGSASGFVTQFRAMREADRHGWRYLIDNLNRANREATFAARAVANYRSGT